MDKPCFEIGLVGAGAVSAGAYTGGVIDFMVQALDEWYAAKSNPDTAPPHDVKLSVFSGASAGAITAALATGYLASNQPSVTNETEAAANRGRNKLFDSWVDRIDITPLLGQRDLADGKSVVSVLDSTILDEIANDGLDITCRDERRPFVADNFHLLLTVTNLRGAPYRIALAGSQANGHTMSLHSDYVHFALHNIPPLTLPDRYSMTWADLCDNNSEIKRRLKAAALASGAFPVGLAPRQLDHCFGKPDPYSARAWRIPTPDSNPHRCFTDEQIQADFGTLSAGYRYDYLCVDGGVMDNEPLELARRLLAGSNNHNARNHDVADRAVVLIDPFPGDAMFHPEYIPPRDLLKTMMSLFGALKNQARFKVEELTLAAHPQVYSRFMIAPSRDGQPHAIACGALGGFGGFLKRDFRKHDYFLGRRNAQHFFRQHFVLTEDNPLFGNWGVEMKTQFCVRDETGAPVTLNGQKFLPIIPLVGNAAAECFAPQWPSYTVRELDSLCEKVEARVELVLKRLVNQYFKTNNILIRFGASFFLRRKTADIVEFVRKTISQELIRMGIMP